MESVDLLTYGAILRDTGMTPSQVDRAVALQDFPRPTVAHGPTLWHPEEVLEWCRSRRHAR